MTFGEKLYRYLSADTDISNLIADRIYPNNAPANTDTPYIVYSVVSNVSSYTLDGNTGNQTRRVQIDILSADYVNIDEIENTISAAMDNWPQKDTEIQSVSKLNAVDGFEAEAKLNRKILDFSVSM